MLAVAVALTFGPKLFEAHFDLRFGPLEVGKGELTPCSDPNGKGITASIQRTDSAQRSLCFGTHAFPTVYPEIIIHQSKPLLGVLRHCSPDRFAVRAGRSHSIIYPVPVIAWCQGLHPASRVVGISQGPTLGLS